MLHCMLGLVEERLVCVGLVLSKSNCEFCSTMDLRIRGGSGLRDTLKIVRRPKDDTVSTMLALSRTHTHTYTSTHTHTGVIGYNLGGCNSEM